MSQKIVINNALLRTIEPGEKVYELRDSKLTGFIIRVYPSGRMTYVCQYARGKRATIGRTDALTPTLARERAKQILADVVKGADPQAAKRVAKAHTLESYITDVYAPWLETHHADGTASLKRLETHFFGPFGKRKLGDITAWYLEKWRSGRIKDGTSPATVNRDINALKAALTRAVTWGFIKENPLVSVKPLKVDNSAKIRYLSDGEEDRVRAALDAREEGMRRERASANDWRSERGYELLPDLDDRFTDHLRPMVVLCLNTGLRRGELFNLTWTDVDLGQGMLTIRGEGAKSGQTRYVPLNDEALSTLKEWQTQRGESEPVFPGQHGARLTNVKSSWRNLMNAAKITAFRFHDLRHHFASRLVMAGIDLNTVRELLGHADIKMTLRYAHLAPAVKAAAVQTLVRSDTKVLHAVREP